MKDVLDQIPFYPMDFLFYTKDNDMMEKDMFITETGQKSTATVILRDGE